MRERVSHNLTLLQSQPTVDPQRIGIAALAIGGYLVTELASQPGSNGIHAAVVYYGVFDVPEHIRNLRVPVLAFQGDADVFVKQARAMEQIARNSIKPFELVIYKNAHRGFEFGVTPGPEDSFAVDDSWKRMIAFMDEHLKHSQH